MKLLGRLLRSEYLTLLICLGYAFLMSLVAPGFASPGNAVNVLFGMLPLFIVATGQTLVLITAGIDLSITSIIALSSVAGAALITSEGGPLSGSWLATPTAVLLMIAIGAFIGLLNGLCISALKMPAFIVTLTSMMFFGGLAVWSTQSRSIYGLPSSFLQIGQNVWYASALAIAVGLAAQLMLTRTLLGQRMRAIGGNVETARVSGVPVGRTITLAYVLSGICAGLASIVITGQLETGSPVQWENKLLDVVGATVIGGTSLYGGRGNVIWTLAGVLLLELIDNSLNLLNMSHFTIMIVKGGVILSAATLDTVRRRMTSQ